MGSGMVFYITTLLVYGAVDIMACIGLNQQFGVAGVTNFGYIIFQAAGAYTAAILSLPADSANGGFQNYVGGWGMPFPIPWIAAALVGALLAVPFTFLVGKRLRGDFAAIGLLVAAVMVNLLVTNYRPFLNGAAGLSLVPSPLQGTFDPQSLSYQLVYAGVAIVLAVLVWRFCHHLTESPYGRSLRAMREDDTVADSLGKNIFALRTQMLVLGGAIAGLSGAVLVGFITLWDPAAWGYAETIVLFAAVIIGGAGNHKGAILGAILVPLGFEEATRFIPAIGAPGLIPALQWVAIGLLIVLFLWLRPTGILPERRRMSLPVAGPAITVPATATSSAGAADVAAVAAVADVAADRHVADAVQGVVEGASAGLLFVQPARPIGLRGLRDGSPDDDVMLEAVGISRSFEGVHAVQDVSFALRRGKLTGLIGPNGAGKSTTLAMLAGTLPVTSGTIRLRGIDVTAMAAYRRARLGLIRTFQLASEFKRLTVMENLLCAVPQNPGDTFGGAVAGRHRWGAAERANTERARTLLAQFGLSDKVNDYAGDLSGGQRRLVEIMRALMAEPEILLLDEPMAGVHPRLAERIGEYLLGLCEQGMTIAMIEHELAYMDRFCDPVIVMAEGRVLAQGTMDALRGRPEVVEAYLVG